ncbi:MAG: phosphoglycerate dehydrogenase [Coriobacteriales bacterium]|nr:phosphoglycerate dehydrogenase [Coriobacteriales bacterium]
MRILVAEKIAVEGLNLLEDSGYDVDVRLNLSPQELIDIIPSYEALIVRSATQVTRDVITAGADLKIIGRAGVGIDNIDIDAATEHGVIVCNAPTSNIIATAEYTMGLMQAIARRIPQANTSMKGGKWERSRFVGSELYGKTLAIFGLGRIGGLVAERAAAFGMKLVGYDPYCSPERAAHLGVTLYDTLWDILPVADFISIHLPKSPETMGMFGAEQFAIMKDGVYIINTARGGIIDLESLADFIAAGKIGGAAIDVFDKEPCFESPLHEFDNVIVTPHLAASTREAQNRAGLQIAEYVSLGLEGRMVPTAVNVAQTPPEVMEAVGPYIGACQMTGTVIAQLLREGLSSLDMEVRGPLAAYDVHVLATACLRAIFAASSDDPVNFVNADYIAEQRGVQVRVTKDPQPLDYANSVKFVARAGEQVVDIACTLGGPNAEPRIVSIFGYDLDLIPSKNVMILFYDDVPGRLGTIGTILGDAGINIATMELGNSCRSNRVNSDGIACVLMNTDQPVPPQVQQRIAAAIKLQDSYYIHL